MLTPIPRYINIYGALQEMHPAIAKLQRKARKENVKKKEKEIQNICRNR